MKLHPLSLTLLLVFTALAGCGNPPAMVTTTTTVPPASPCAAGYYVGCDGNTDAAMMLNRHGLHQITNFTAAEYSNEGGHPRDRPNHPRIDGGLIVWTEGGFNEPRTYHALRPSSNVPFRLDPPKGQAGGWAFPSECCVIHDWTPRTNTSADWANATVWLWRPFDNTKIQIALPKGAFQVWGFDGDWALLRKWDDENPNTQAGMWAVNVHTGQARELVPIQQKPAGVYFGDHLQWQVASGHSAFISVAEETPPRYQGVLTEYNLDTGESTELLRTNQSLIGYYDASPRYLALPTSAFGDPGIWLMDRLNRTWWRLETDPQAQVSDPKVAGDWVIFGERMGGKSTLAGVHLPTRTKHDLVTLEEGLSLEKWDTDGQYVVVSARLDPNDWAKYFGVQIYWMGLPKTS